MPIIQSLTSLPHRGTGTPQENQAADIIVNLLTSAGANVKRQSFNTPKTYIWEVIWLTTLIAAGLAAAPFLSWISVGILAFCTLSSFLFFDWRSSPLGFLSPSVTSENIIGSMKNKRKKNKEKHELPCEADPSPKHLILMAHYDSAPVSLLYLPSMVKNFRSSLFINLFLIVFALLITLLSVLNIGEPVVSWLRWILAVYFLIQGLITSFDYLRYGYTNGASDNATGTAAAMVTAMRLWENPVPGLKVSVVLTGAEETGMTGSKYYFKINHKRLPFENTFVLNFDSLGKGDLKIITKTGSLSTIVYKNKLVDAAIRTARDDIKFNRVKTASWHTGDFDTIWFARAGIPCLTLTAQDKDAAIPHLHRPEDVIENIDEPLTEFTIDFAENLIRRL